MNIHCWNNIYKYLTAVILLYGGNALYCPDIREVCLSFNASCSTEKDSFFGVRSAIFNPKRHVQEYYNQQTKHPLTFTIHDFEQLAAQRELSSADLFKQHHLFCYPGYIQLLLQQPNYEKEITTIHNTLQVAYNNRLSKLCGLIIGNYSVGLAHCVAQEMAYNSKDN